MDDSARATAKRHLNAMRGALAPLSLNPTEQPVETDEDAADHQLEALRIRYEMELAAHRATTERLIAAKDEIIASPRHLIEQLQTQLTPTPEVGS